MLQGRVPPEIHQRAHRGAARRNVSMALYLEMLVAADELADDPEKDDAREPQESAQLELPSASGL